MLFAGFIGPAYRARSETIAADTLINLYQETTHTPAETKAATYYGTPGTRALVTADTHACRGVFSEDGRTFTVIGANVYEVDTAVGTLTFRGTIDDDGKPVYFASNGRGGEQLAIRGGIDLKIFDFRTNLLSAAVTLPLTNAPGTLDFVDGYFLLSERDTIRVWFSNLENGLVWDALDFFARSQTSDNVVAARVLKGRVWVFGGITTDVYYDSGDADTPFIPYPGSIMQEGLSNADALTISGESFYWLAQDGQGRNRFVSASDYSPVTISTPPISFAVASYPNTELCEVLAYESEGHPFVAWTFPSSATWCWDTREQQWHQRSSRDVGLGLNMPWRVRGCASTADGILVGDRFTGVLSFLDLDVFAENGAMIYRERTAPYVSAENQWLFLDRVELGVQTGVGLVSGQGSAPTLELQVSRDGAHAFVSAGTASFGALGEYATRAIWRMLGRARADRLALRVTSTDPVRQVWGPGLWLKARPGTGQL